MKSFRELTTEQLRDAIWNMNNGRDPGNGIIPDKDAIRQELWDRTRNPLGYHEQPYNNDLKQCECHKCEIAFRCPFRDKYQRHPPELAPGALGLCRKL